MPEYRYTVVLHPDPHSGGYAVEVPALPGCFTQGASREEALDRAKEAIRCHVEGLLADGESVPTEHEHPQLAVVSIAA